MDVHENICETFSFPRFILKFNYEQLNRTQVAITCEHDGHC